MAAVSPAVLMAGTSSLDTNRCDNINTPHFDGPQPAKCHIYVHKDFMTLHHATAAKKREEEEYIPFLLCSGYLLKTFIIRCYSKSSSWHRFPPTTHTVLYYIVLCIVVATVPTPPNDEGAPFVLSAVSCTALQYLHTIYSLLSIYTVSTLYLSTLYPPIKLLRHIILGA